MTNDKKLDALIDGLKSQPLDRDLTNLEPEVWARIDARKRPGFQATPAAVTADGRISAAPALSRTAAVALALAIGLVVGLFGGPGSSPANDFSVFSIDAPYAPSGLLG